MIFTSKYYEPIYYDVAVLYVTNYATETPLLT